MMRQHLRLAIFRLFRFFLGCRRLTLNLFLSTSTSSYLRLPLHPPHQDHLHHRAGLLLARGPRRARRGGDERRAAEHVPRLARVAHLGHRLDPQAQQGKGLLRGHHGRHRGFRGAHGRAAETAQGRDGGRVHVHRPRRLQGQRERREREKQGHRRLVRRFRRRRRARGRHRRRRRHGLPGGRLEGRARRPRRRRRARPGALEGQPDLPPRRQRPARAQQHAARAVLQGLARHRLCPRAGG